MVRRALASLAVLTACFAFIAPAGAQDIAVAPAHIARVDGQVTLERSGQVESAPLNMPVIAGDHLRTDDGRLEVMLAEGGTLALDRGTSVDVQSAALVSLKDGRVRLTIPAPMRAAPFRIDSPAGSVRVSEAGEYRITMLHGTSGSASASETQVELAVVYGAADLFTDEGSTRVRPGESAYASAGYLPSETYAFNTASTDDFDHWVEGQPEERGASAQYLPSDLREYSTTFDSYGDWQYVQPYGYVWYPRVSAGWRPYYNGRWMSYPRYGWTWIGADAFAYPTHHYGRWGLSAGSWFWIPESHWGPAFVSWGYAPGYVSWCPLGLDNRPVLGITANVSRRALSPWNAWTVVASAHFGHGLVPDRVVRTSTWGSATHPAFAVRAGGPSVREMAVPRYVNRGDAIVQSQTARPVAPSRLSTRDAPARRDSAVTRGQTAPSTQRTPMSVASIPVYRGGVSSTTPAQSYRTRPPATAGAPARTRQTNPVYAPDYSPRYQPNYAPRYEPNATQRSGSRPPVMLRGTPPAATPRMAPPQPAATAARPAPPAAGRGGTTAPAAHGSAVAVPRRGGRGGGAL